jgi:hydrogenase nickel incorporation protein HypA/HybF
MHEVGIAQNLIEQVEKKVAELNQPIKKLDITVLLGKQAGVSSEALQFGFQIAKRNSRISFAQLVIEEVPLKYQCLVCRHLYPTEELNSICPECGERQLKLIEGKELSLKTLEYE